MSKEGDSTTTLGRTEKKECLITHGQEVTTFKEEESFRFEGHVKAKLEDKTEEMT